MTNNDKNSEMDSEEAQAVSFLSQLFHAQIRLIVSRETLGQESRLQRAKQWPGQAGKDDRGKSTWFYSVNPIVSRLKSN